MGLKLRFTGQSQWLVYKRARLWSSRHLRCFEIVDRFHPRLHFLKAQVFVEIRYSQSFFVLLPAVFFDCCHGGRDLTSNPENQDQRLKRVLVQRYAMVIWEEHERDIKGKTLLGGGNCATRISLVLTKIFALSACVSGQAPECVTGHHHITSTVAPSGSAARSKLQVNLTAEHTTMRWGERALSSEPYSMRKLQGCCTSSHLNYSFTDYCRFMMLKCLPCPSRVTYFTHRGQIIVIGITFPFLMVESITLLSLPCLSRYPDILPIWPIIYY